MQLLLLDLGAFFFFFCKVKSELLICCEHGLDHADGCPSAVPILLPLHIPQLLILGHLFNFRPNSPSWCCCTLQSCFGSSMHLQRVRAQQLLHPQGAGSSALAGSPACAMPHGRVSHPAPTAAFSLSQQRGENSVLQSAGCFPGEAGCVASPAEGWCLYCFTTSWLHSAKSGIWMKSKKKTPPAWPFAGVGSAACHPREMQGGEVSPIPN